jgi:hypothetical protein
MIPKAAMTVKRLARKNLRPHSRTQERPYIDRLKESVEHDSVGMLFVF